MPSDLPRLVTRVPNDINDKFLAICENQNRTASNLLALIVKDFVSQYELNNGDLTIDSNGKYHITKKHKLKGVSSSLKSG